MCQWFYLRRIAMLGVMLSLSPALSSQVLIVRTAPPYAQEIETALKQGLDNAGIGYFPTVIAHSNLQDTQATLAEVKSLLAQKPLLFATIGTQASTPLKALSASSGIPLVFAGVTYPVENNLIAAFGEPTGTTVTGIGYAISQTRRLKVIRELFPDYARFKRIAFIYSSKVLQEFVYLTWLKKVRQAAGFTFVEIDIYDPEQDKPSVDKLSTEIEHLQPDLGFGWFTLDQLSGKPAYAKQLATLKLPMLGITGSHVEKDAVAGILSDHAWIGAEQARIVREILVAGKSAGEIPPLEPDTYQIELNLKRAAELGLEFPPAVIEQAGRVIR